VVLRIIARRGFDILLVGYYYCCCNLLLYIRTTTTHISFAIHHTTLSLE
jgi:hypothetical protein